MYFDRVDIVQAHYAFCCDYHEGQASRLYARLCLIQTYFHPGPIFRGMRSLSPNAREIYDTLVAKEKKRANRRKA